jgi:hypothetical protein
MFKQLLKDKRGAELRYIFYAIVVVSMAVIAIGINMTEWSNKYDSGVDPDLSGFDKLEEISGVATGQQRSISPDDPDPGIDAEATTFRSVFGILTNIFSPLRTVIGTDGMIEEARVRMGLPDYIIRGSITLMIFAVIFTLIAIIFRIGKR